jgi:hypothetical protein
MKKDPNTYCINYEENIGWELLHDLVAHPLMALTLYKSKLVISFHDFTSSKAWIRKN